MGKYFQCFSILGPPLGPQVGPPWYARGCGKRMFNNVHLSFIVVMFMQVNIALELDCPILPRGNLIATRF